MDVPEASELPRDLVFVDLETTGGNAAHHRITEIGMVRVHDDSVVEEWSTLVNPGCVIPPYIEAFTGITNEMVEGAPGFAEVAGAVLDRLRGSSDRPKPVFAAHNARFDYSFLRTEFRRLGIGFSAPVLCTVKLSRRLFPEHPRHSLDALMERHALACDARHRALGDARVIREFWSLLRASTPEADLAAAVRSAQGTVKLPPHLPEGLVDELPEGPGVYRFHGPDRELLFVGRGGCLRSAILAHFADGRAGRRGRRLEDEVRSIDWVETAGPFGAMLRELKEAERLEARRGRPSNRRSSEASGARSSTLRIREESGACKGACAGKEPLVLHALRTRMALSSLKLKPWPFPGRIALVERGAMGAVDSHVLDHWAYLGTARDEEELESLAGRAVHPGFDARVYRILVRHFANHPKPEWVDLEAASHRSTAMPIDEDA